MHPRIFIPPRNLIARGKCRPAAAVSGHGVAVISKHDRWCDPRGGRGTRGYTHASNRGNIERDP